jgi:hypothetical protein
MPAQPPIDHIIRDTFAFTLAHKLSLKEPRLCNCATFAPSNWIASVGNALDRAVLVVPEWFLESANPFSLHFISLFINHDTPINCPSFICRQNAQALRVRRAEVLCDCAFSHPDRLFETRRDGLSTSKLRPINHLDKKQPIRSA